MTQKTKGRPTGVDLHVGKKLRAMRNARRISQQHLGAQVGVTFQQMQKYESGKNRISASRLYQFSQALDVPVGAFYEGL
jgi:transcriptional regulator with XRE-family HTH domain